MPTPRLSAQVRKLRASYRAPKAPGKPTDAGQAIGAEPEFLTGRQGMMWRRLVEILPPGMLQRCDRDLLATWIVMVDRFRTAARKLADQETSPTEVASLRKEMNDTARLQAMLSDRLGFSPAARQRVTIPLPETKDGSDPWTAFRLVPGGRG